MIIQLDIDWAVESPVKFLRSTVDALQRLKSLTAEARERAEGVLAPALQRASATPPQGSKRTELAPPEFGRATNEVSSTLCRRSEEHGAVWRPSLGERTQQEGECCPSAQTPAGHSAEGRKDLPHGRARCGVRPRWYSSLEARSWGFVCHLSLDGRQDQGAWKAPGPGAVRRRHEDMTRAQFDRHWSCSGPMVGTTARVPHVPSGAGADWAWLLRFVPAKNRARGIPVCHKCGAADDTVQHTLAVCTGWEEQRRVLTAVVGRDLSLPSLVIAMLGSEGCWKVVASFCEEVILQKEAAERERENDPLAPSLRRRRRGRRRQLYDRSTLPPGGGQQAGGAGAPLSPSSDGNGLAFRAFPSDKGGV
ncbi:uncharacterized protein LOC135076679 [Ostrinia nubilalis]|uniref:uncharacterized protein LOC135076679 n=1 Tax=Ostrinia nubilalis TaxID=29057 RepID=UPI0030822A05